LKDIVQRGHDGLFYDYRELLKEIQASYNAESQTTEMAVLEPVLTTELLVLDDLGSSKPSAWALETVGHILNSRYNDKRITIITTNYLDTLPAAPGTVRFPSGQGVATVREDTLADRVGQRIRSRLMEMCRTLDIVAPDFRERFRQASRFK
jgi:DNA replication protein DnaC